MEKVRYTGAKGFSGYGGYAKPNSNSVWYNGYEFIWNDNIGDWVYWFSKGGHSTPIKYKDVVSGRQKLEQPVMAAPASAPPLSVPHKREEVEKKEAEAEPKSDDDNSYRRYYQRANDEQYVVDANRLPNLHEKDADSFVGEVEKNFTAAEKEYDKKTEALSEKELRYNMALTAWSRDNEILDAVVDHLITGERSDKLPESIGRIVVLSHRKLSNSDLSSSDADRETIRKAVIDIINDEMKRSDHKVWSRDYEREQKWARATRRSLCPYNNPDSPNREFLRNLDFDFRDESSLDEDIEEQFLVSFRHALDIVGEIADNFGLDLTNCSNFINKYKKLNVVVEDHDDVLAGSYHYPKNQITLYETHGSISLSTMVHELGHAIEHGIPGMQMILARLREEIKDEEVVRTMNNGDVVFSAKIPVPSPDYTMREYAHSSDSSEMFSTFVEELACHPELFYPNVYQGENKGCNEYFNRMAGLIRRVLFWNRDYEQFLLVNDQTQRPFIQKFAQEIQELETLDEYESYREKFDDDWKNVYSPILLSCGVPSYESISHSSIISLLYQKHQVLLADEYRQTHPIPDANDLPNIHTAEGHIKFEILKDKLSDERDPDEKEYDKETNDRHELLSWLLTETNNFLKVDSSIARLADAIETDSLDDWVEYLHPKLCDLIRKTAKSNVFLYPQNDAKTNAVETVSHVKAELQSELDLLPKLRESYDNRLARRVLMPQNFFYSDNRVALRELAFTVKDEQFAVHSDDDENNLRLAFDIVGNIADNLGLDLASSPLFDEYKEKGIDVSFNEYLPGANCLGSWASSKRQMTLYQPDKNKNEFHLATMVHEAGHAIVSMIPGLKKRLVMLRDSLATDVHSQRIANFEEMTIMNSSIPVPKDYSMARFTRSANHEEMFSTFVESLVTNPTIFFPNSDERYETGRSQFFNLIVEAVKDVGVINKELQSDWNDDNIKSSSGYKLFKKLFDEADTIDAVNQVADRLKCYCETACVAEADYPYRERSYGTMLKDLFANTRTEKQVEVSRHGR